MKQILAAAFLILSGGIFSTFAQQGDELYEELSVRLQQAETLVASVLLQDETGVTEEQMAALSVLNRQIRGSLFSDLIDRSDLLLLLTKEQMRIHQDPQEQQDRFDRILYDSRQDAGNRLRSDSREKVLRASFITTLSSFALAFTFWGLGEMQDRRYFESTTIEGATLHRRLFQVFSIGSMVGAAVGAVSGGVTATLYSGAR